MKKADILRIKEIIEENEKKEIQIETKLETQYKTAKETFGCSTTKEIEDKLDSLEEEMDKIEKTIEEKGAELVGAYDWGI